MNDKEWKIQKKRIKKFVDKWIPLLNLDKQIITINYVTGTSNHNVNGFVGCAVTKAIWMYHEAAIDFFVETLADVDDEELERVVLHELCHVMLNPMETPELDQDKNEFTTEALTRAFLNVERHYEKMGKKRKI